jgi:hypothetical protein
MRRRVNVFVAAPLIVASISCQATRHAKPDDIASPADVAASTQPPPTPTPAETWKRMRECAEQADRLALRLKWQSSRSTGDVGWANHYNEKLNRCFVVLTIADLKKKQPTVFEEVYDASEGAPLCNRLIESLGSKDIFCNATNHPWTEPLSRVDCTEYRKMLQDRLEN